MPGDLFEPGSLDRSTYDCEEDIHTFLDEFNAVHRIIDYLYGKRPDGAAVATGDRRFYYGVPPGFYISEPLNRPHVELVET